MNEVKNPGDPKKMSLHGDRNRYKVIATAHLYITNANNEVLLQRRKNTGYLDGEYCLIGGHLEEDETIIETAIREGWEEIGLHFKQAEMDFLQVSHRKKGNEFDEDRLDFFFGVRYDGEVFSTEPDKSDALTWFKLTNLPHNTVYYINDFLSNINKKYSEVGW